MIDKFVGHLNFKLLFEDFRSIEMEFLRIFGNLLNPSYNFCGFLRDVRMVLCSNRRQENRKSNKK